MIAALRNRLSLFVGLFDAGVVSLGGFVTNVLAGRYLGTDDYGIFAALYAVSTIALVFQSALVSGPYAVLSQTNVPGGARSYLAGSLGFSAMLGVISGALCVGIGVFSLNTTPASDHSGAPWLVYFVYVFLMVLQDFARRVFYSHRKERLALLLDVVSFGTQILFLVVGRSHLSANSVFLILAGTTLLALAVSAGRMLPRFDPVLLRWSNIQQALTTNWDFGRWNLASSGVSWIANQLYIVAVSAFQPPTAAAQLNAARSVAAISNPLVMAVETMGTPRAARIASSRDSKALRKMILTLAISGGVLFGAIGVFFFMYPNQSIELLFGKSFGDMKLLVRLFSLMPVLWVVGRTYAVGTQSMQKPRALLPVYVVAAALTLTLGVYLTRAYGAVGGAIGLLVNSIVLSFGFGLQFYRITGKGI